MVCADTITLIGIAGSSALKLARRRNRGQGQYPSHPVSTVLQLVIHICRPAQDWQIPPAALGQQPCASPLPPIPYHAGYELKDELAAWLLGVAMRSRTSAPTVRTAWTTRNLVRSWPRRSSVAAPSAASPSADRASEFPSPSTGRPVCCAGVGDPLSARLAREHNGAHVLAMGARLIGNDMAQACVSAFLGTHFAGGRRQRRVDQLSSPPAGHD